MNATDVMKSLNSHALHASEDGRQIFIEDHSDSDGRMFRLEYHCDYDGTNAEAFCLHNPWGNNWYSYEESHLDSDGFICIGPHSRHDSSPYDLKFAVLRTRFWCTGYSYLCDHSYEETCAAIPEWRGQ